MKAKTYKCPSCDWTSTFGYVHMDEINAHILGHINEGKRIIELLQKQLIEHGAEFRGGVND